MTAALKKGCRNLGLIGLLGLATTGLYGYVLFWSWLFWPRVGRLVALVCPIAALAVTLIIGRTLAGPARKLLRASLVPILLIGVYAIMVLGLGFMYGGLDTPFKTAERRFSHPLPNDNAIPFIFAEGVWWHVIEKPLVGDWHSSDRPPLQTGLTLAPERFLPHDREMTAQMVGVFTQSTWILALWAFLLTLEIDSEAVLLVHSGCMTSGFVLTNTSLGFIALGLPLLLLGSQKQFRTRYWTIAVSLLVFLIATVVVWCVLMFGPFTTVLHQGTYAVPLLAFTA
ncbi:MAG TPA: hypothetical protein VH302_13240, partial [Bryobacteraceae bacterium]|nr:hypothetical protein [Bryobacteraceae bacterium]